VRGKELGRDIPLQTRQVGFGISAARPVLKPAQIASLSRFGFHALTIFSLGQNSLANAAGTSDTTNYGFVAALEEHCLDSRHALHATGTTRHS
jgi:hypothetical protein